MIKIQCEQCGKLMSIPSAFASTVTCSCGAKYETDPASFEYHRIVPEISSFFRPGEPTRDTCTTELLAALKKRRESDREIEFWERKLREAV